MAATRKLVFYDDARARTFEPFALSRPLCEMRVGALLVRERWEMALRAASVGFVSATHLAQFTEEGAPAPCTGSIPVGAVLVNSRAAIALSDNALRIMRSEEVKLSEQNRAWYVDGTLAAIQLRRPFDASLLHDGTVSLSDIIAIEESELGVPAGETPSTASGIPAVDGHVYVSGAWVHEVWDIVAHLSTLLNADIPELAATLPCRKTENNQPFGAFVVGDHPVFVERDAVVEPFTVFDTTLGPVLVRAGATVQSFTRVVGPCYIGRNSTVMGDRISGSSIGDTCRVHGELSATVFVGHSNKGHDGFVGHSIVGRWVNMGAGTITSNLKNTYGTVALWTPSGVRDTKLQFLGTLFGDHAKTGIGMKLTTGCVLGMGANVFDRMPPKVVEPFAWGSGAPYDSYDVNKFVETAERMMSRRRVELTDAGRAAMLAAHAARWRTP